jgi:hypothetical protein
MSPNPPEVTYRLLDVHTPVPSATSALPSLAKRYDFVRAARRAFKGMPWRGSNQPPQYHR